MPARARRWPDPRVKPRYVAAEIDWSPPLAAGLVAYLLMNQTGGNSVMDLVRRVSWPFSDAGATKASWVASTQGVGADLGAGPGSLPDRYVFVKPVVPLSIPAGSDF